MPGRESLIAVSSSRLVSGTNLKRRLYPKLSGSSVAQSFIIE